MIGNLKLINEITYRFRSAPIPERLDCCGFLFAVGFERLAAACLENNSLLLINVVDRSRHCFRDQKALSSILRTGISVQVTTSQC